MITTEVKTDELRRDNILRHFPTMLHRWHGKRATLCHLTESHRAIHIKISDTFNGPYMYIACLGPLEMQGKFELENSSLEVRRNNDSTYTVYDSKQLFELKCGAVEVKEINGA